MEMSPVASYDKNSALPHHAIDLTKFFSPRWYFIFGLIFIALMHPVHAQAQSPVLKLVVDLEQTGGIVEPLNTIGQESSRVVFCIDSSSPGCDYSADDQIVRTHDLVQYKFAYEFNDLDGGNITDNIVIRATLSPGLTWDGILPAFCDGAQSGYLENNSILVCDLDEVSSGTAEDLFFFAKAGGTNLNGTQVPITVEIEGEQAVKVTDNSPDNVVTITAAPRWNIRKSLNNRETTTIGGTTYVLMRYRYWLETWDVTLVGNEALGEVITFTDEFTIDPDNDDIYTPAPSAELHECYINNGTHYQSLASAPQDKQNQAVSNAGAVTCLQPTGSGGPILVTITGADTSLDHYPTHNTSNKAAAAGKRIAAHGFIVIRVPAEYIAANSPLNTHNEYTNFDPVSISSQSNFLENSENIDDNVYDFAIPGGSGSWHKIYRNGVNSNGLVGTTSGWRAGDGLIAPNKDFASRQHLENNGSIALTDVVLCDIIDKNTYTLQEIDNTDQAVYVKTGNNFYAGTTSVEYGINYDSGSWPPASQPNKNAVATECGDPMDSTGWYTSLSSVPGGAENVTKVRVRLNAPLETGKRIQFWLSHTTRDTYPYGGKIPNGTILPNFATFRTNELRDGAWLNNTYDMGSYPGNHKARASGDRVMLSRATARIEKETVPDDSVNASEAGGLVTYKLKPRFTSDVEGLTSRVTIEDRLPKYMSYGGEYITTQNIVGFSAVDNGDDTTTLYWDLGVIPANEPIGDIEFTAIVQLNAPNNSTLKNTAIIHADEDGAAESVRTAYRNIQVTTPAGVKIIKEVYTPVIEPDDAIEYQITYANLSSDQPDWVDIIDILPWNGDSRGSSYNGGYNVTQVFPSSNSYTIYTTLADPASLDADPDAASNTLENSSIWTVCSTDAICVPPNGTTAIRLRDNQVFTQGALRTISIELQTFGNQADDAYFNRAKSRADKITLSPTSNVVKTIVVDEDHGVRSGTVGGLESGPLDVEPSDFIGGIGDPGTVEASQTTGRAQVQTLHKARLNQSASLTLTDLLPKAGPHNTTASAVVPVDVLAVTTAPDAKAVDFVDESGTVRAVALGVTTLDGPYEHDYGVCTRFEEFTLDLVSPVKVATANGDERWFWRMRSSQDALREEALLFHVFVDESGKKLHIDSRWLKDDYPAEMGFDYDYVFNMQLWSTTLRTSKELLESVLANIETLDSEAWEVVYHNTSVSERPLIFIQKATYQGDAISLSIQNQTGEDQVVDISGSWRTYEDRTSQIAFSDVVTATAGTSNYEIDFPGLLDVTAYLKYEGFVDKVYTGGGLWFDFSNTPTAETAITVNDCRSVNDFDQSDLILSGCTELSASNVQKADEVGLGRTLNPNGLPVDISPYRAVRFWAKGNGSPVRLLLEADDVADGDHAQTVFTPTAEWQQFIIPLSEFTQRGFGVERTFTGTNIKSAIWLNADATNGTFDLEVDLVSFTNNALLQVESLAGDTAETAPQDVEIAVDAGLNVRSMTLYYSLDDGHSFQAINAVADVAGQAQEGYIAQIPGQPLGSDVHYYIEIVDGNGYTSKNPIDAPESLFRYRVDDRGGLLVDDYAGGNLTNRLGGKTTVFNHAEVGGSLRAYIVDQQLGLTYQVESAEQLAGYTTWLDSLDATSFSTIDLLVKGKAGGEQLSLALRDDNDFEPRVSLGDLLPGGITTEWQWVQVPLSMFPSALNRQNLHNMSFVFANGEGASSGQIYINELRFTTLNAPLYVHTFDDPSLDSNSQGAATWQNSSAATLELSTGMEDAQQESGQSLRMTYDVTLGGYVLWGNSLGMDLTGATGLENGSISLWVKHNGASASQSDGQEVLAYNLYLSDGTTRARVALGDYGEINTQWTLLQIPLRSFDEQGVNLAKLQEMQIAIEFGEGSGELWIDNITLGTSGAPQASKRVYHVVGNNINGNDDQPLALHLPDGGYWTVSSDSSWLWVENSQQASSANLTVGNNSWNYQPGQYEGVLTVTDEQGESEEIRVFMTVNEYYESDQMFLPIFTKQ